MVIINNKKGFTLIELIVSMAILSILMTAVFAMFSPVNKFYVNTDNIDKRFTASNGIMNYISENIRYSKCIYIFAGVDDINNKKLEDSTSSKGHIYEFFMSDAGLDSSLSGDLEKVQVISLENGGTNTFNGKSYYGRVYRTKGLSASNKTRYSDFSYGKYELFGAGYYGPFSYKFTPSVTYTEGGIVKTTDTSDKQFALSITMTGDDGINHDFSTVIPYINFGKTGSKKFYYFNPTTSTEPPTLKCGELKKGENIYIMFY